MSTEDDQIRQAVNAGAVAVVGASNDREKYGNIIYRDLSEAGFTVYAVNPNADAVEGDPVFQRLQDIPETPIVADVVVPPEVGKRVADDAAAAGTTYFWLQPGAESPELIEYASGLGLTVIHDNCIMVARRLYRE